MRPWPILVTWCLLACGSEKPPHAEAGGAGGEAGATSDPCDGDRDGFLSQECSGDDCDDARADIHPGAEDICDGDDNDCDGVADPGEVCGCAEPPPPATIAFSERVCLPGGWFQMGMDSGDPQAPYIDFIAEPMHRVFVSPFYLDAYEVTNRRFIACLDEGACEIEENPSVPSATWQRKEQSTEDQLDRPYWGASAQGAETFCAWAGGWLPSEAQWERAATGLDAGGQGPRLFPHGNDPPTCEQEWTRDCVPFDPNAGFPTGEHVGQLLPNPEGIYDLGGNVVERVADLFSMLPYEACPEPCKNPCFGCSDKTGGDPSLAPDQEPWPWSHVIRGGSISLPVSDPKTLVFSRSQYRDRGIPQADAPTGEPFNYGFRCAYR